MYLTFHPTNKWFHRMKCSFVPDLNFLQRLGQIIQQVIYMLRPY